MELEKRREYIQKAYFLQKHGKTRDELYDYLLAVGFEKTEIAGVLDVNEAKIKRVAIVEKNKFSLKTPTTNNRIGNNFNMYQYLSLLCWF